jgi:biopolymer transport protein ExbD
MAELIAKGNPLAEKGTRRCKKMSTKVDLTPMVDLGFLLITFFIFTTSMAAPKTMQLFLPAGEEPTTDWGESTALTIIPIGGNRVFYYHGKLNNAIPGKAFGVTSYDFNQGIGDIIRLKQKSLDASAKFKRSDMVLIIKPASTASYQNITDALDEVLINGLKHYSLVDIDIVEVNELKRMSLL